MSNPMSNRSCRTPDSRLSTPNLSLLASDLCPGSGIVRRTRRVQHQLHAIAIFKSGSVFYFGFTSAQSFDDGARQRGESPGPTGRPHAGSHSVLMNLYRSPRSRAGGRMPKFPSLFDHQCSRTAIYFQAIGIVARFDNRKQSGTRRTFR